MKNLIFILALTLAFFSCKQTEPEIETPETPEAVVVNFPKKVLIENFTGVRCPSCPSGNAELESLISMYDDLIAVTIHMDDFGTPFPSSQFDFRSQEAEEIAEFLGRPIFYPSAVIDRKDFPGGNTFLQNEKSFWAGHINEEVEISPAIIVSIDRDYDSVTRELKIKTSGISLEDLIGELRLTIMITENNIVDIQDGEQGIENDYVHNYVFRTTMTSPTGNSIATDLAQGEDYLEELMMTLPEEWDAANCNVIAFVSLIEGDDKIILQAESVQVED